MEKSRAVEDRSLQRSIRMNNFFKSATRIMEEDDVQNFIQDLVHSKFRLNDRDWYICSSSDGLNVYVDSRHPALERVVTGMADTVSREEMVALLRKNSERVQSSVGGLVGSVGQATWEEIVLRVVAVIVAVLNVRSMRFLAPPLFDFYASSVEVLIGGPGHHEGQQLR